MTQTYNQTRDFIRLNLQTIFSNRLDDSKLECLADELSAKANREDDFIQFADRCIETFKHDPAWPDRSQIAAPKPILEGWDAIPQLLTGGKTPALLALFHHGMHRQLITDLAARGISMVIPIAPKAVPVYERLKASYPTAIEDRFEFVSVADPAVGRKLLRGLRNGRVGVFYVDGGMGPNASEIGALEQKDQIVPFLDRRLRIKSGLTRMAVRLGLTVLPVFARSTCPDQTKGRVHFGDPIEPHADQARETAEQLVCDEVFRQFSKELLSDPVSWEFLSYLHRFVVPEQPIKNNLPHSLDAIPDGACLQLSKERVGTLRRGKQHFLIDTLTQSGYRIPDSLVDMMQAMQTNGVNVRALRQFIRADSTEQTTPFLETLLAEQMIAPAATRTGANRTL